MNIEFAIMCLILKGSATVKTKEFIIGYEFCEVILIKKN